MFAGKITSCPGADFFGCATITAGTASWFVSLRRVLRARTRGTMPVTTTMATTTNASTAISHARLGFDGGSGLRSTKFGAATCVSTLSSCSTCISISPESYYQTSPHVRDVNLLTTPVQHAKEHRHKEQRRNRRQQQSADDRSAQRRILFPAL